MSAPKPVARRLDQLRVAQKEAVGLSTGGDAMKARVGAKPEVDRPTLASQGIDKNLAHQARTLGAMSDDKFEAVVTQARDAVNRAVRSVVTTDDKADRRAERERDLGARKLALPLKRYGVIYADPPWHFQPYSSVSAQVRFRRYSGSRLSEPRRPFLTLADY
jgi:hypothetical protein